MLDSAAGPSAAPEVQSQIQVPDTFPPVSVAVADLDILHARIGALKVRCALWGGGGAMGNTGAHRGGGGGRERAGSGRRGMLLPLLRRWVGWRVAADDGALVLTGGWRWWW